MNNSPPQPDLQSARMLIRLVDRSKRWSGIQLPIASVRSTDIAQRPPLARMLRDGESTRGGRGGAVRLKLYLCMYLLACHYPHDIRPIPARAWAETLALPDPAGLGARRVSDALTWLDKHKMISAVRKRGAAPAVTLLDATGSGGQYKRPGGQYITLPTGFWYEQWITRLSGSAVALLIVLLDLQGGRKSQKEAPWLATHLRPRYGLSDDVWTRASQELTACGLLTIGRIPQGRDFDFRRMRNTYWIDKDRLDKPDVGYPANSTLLKETGLA
jgi:hypothetical protein